MLTFQPCGSKRAHYYDEKGVAQPIQEEGAKKMSRFLVEMEQNERMTSDKNSSEATVVEVAKSEDSKSDLKQKARAHFLNAHYELNEMIRLCQMVGARQHITVPKTERHASVQGLHQDAALRTHHKSHHLQQAAQSLRSAAARLRARHQRECQLYTQLTRLGSGWALQGGSKSNFTVSTSSIRPLQIQVKVPSKPGLPRRILDLHHQQKPPPSSDPASTANTPEGEGVQNPSRDSIVMLLAPEDEDEDLQRENTHDEDVADAENVVPHLHQRLTRVQNRLFAQYLKESLLLEEAQKEGAKVCNTLHSLNEDLARNIPVTSLKELQQSCPSLQAIFVLIRQIALLPNQFSSEEQRSSWSRSILHALQHRVARKHLLSQLDKAVHSQPQARLHFRTTGRAGKSAVEIINPTNSDGSYTEDHKLASVSKSTIFLDGRTLSCTTESSSLNPLEYPFQGSLNDLTALLSTIFPR